MLKLLAAAALALTALIALLPAGPSPARKPAGPGLTLYCAAALRAPVETIVERFEAEHRTSVHIQYGGSNTLLSQIEIGRQGDLFLAADQTYVDLAIEKGLARDAISVAEMTPVVIVARDSSAKVDSLDDLMGLRVAIANPDQAAIGRTTRELLSAIGRWDELFRHVLAHGVTKPTVGDVANDVLLGSVDAGIVWDAVAAQHQELKVISLPELAGGSVEVAVGVLRFTRNAGAARAFCRYLSSQQSGQPMLAEFGFSPLSISSAPESAQ